MKNTIFKLRTVDPSKPLVFDGSKCVGCNNCVNVCPIDLLIPGAKAGAPPETAYPHECWYCGCCVMECPKQVVDLRHPLMNRVQFVEKSSLLEKGD